MGGGEGRGREERRKEKRRKGEKEKGKQKKKKETQIFHNSIINSRNKWSVPLPLLHPPFFCSSFLSFLQQNKQL